MEIHEGTEKPSVSVIILIHNSLKFIEKCLEAVLKTNYEHFEVIIVDNASTDRSIQFIKKKFSQERRLKIIYSKKNLGFAEGNNVGARVARGKYLTFLNVDTVVTPSWLNEIVNVMEAASSIGVAQSKLLLMSKPEFFDSAGDFIDRYGVMMRRGGDLPEKDEGQYDKIEQIFSARGAALTIKHELFKKIGGFDQSYFLTYEDVDLCWRARLHGYKVVFVPNSIVYHYGGFSLSPRRVFLTTRNWLTTLIKNYASSTLLRITPQVIVISIFAALAEIFIKKRPTLASERFRGLLWVILNFKSICIKRGKVQQHIRKVDDQEVISYMMSGNLAISYWTHVWRNQLENKS